MTADPTDQPAAILGRRPSPRVSLCLIVRDEEANLPFCLGGVHDLVDEIVVVDTGSTDATRDVAAKLGARVVEFRWVDDFAAARNEALQHAQGEWVFWLDADHRLDEPARAGLRSLFAALPADRHVGYLMRCVDLGPDDVTPESVVDHVRLFRNRSGVRWCYRAHEQILPALVATGAAIDRANVTVRHLGCHEPAARRRKLDRNRRLLLLEDADRPDNPFTLFNLGSLALETDGPAAALPFLERALSRVHPNDPIVLKLIALTAQAQRRLGRPDRSIELCCEGLARTPDDQELLFEEAAALDSAGDPSEAEAVLRRLVALGGAPVARPAMGQDVGLTSYKARHNVAVLCQRQRRWSEAEEQWRAVVAERPDYVPAWLGLAEAAIAGKRWDDLDCIVAEVDRLNHGGSEPSVLRARGLLGRREFEAARALLSATIARYPGDVRPRVVFSHALLQAGTDWVAAEQALFDVLAVDPDHQEARRNLTLLQCRTTVSNP